MPSNDSSDALDVLEDLDAEAASASADRPGDDGEQPLPDIDALSSENFEKLVAEAKHRDGFLGLKDSEAWLRVWDRNIPLDPVEEPSSDDPDTVSDAETIEFMSNQDFADLVTLAKGGQPATRRGSLADEIEFRRVARKFLLGAER